MAGKGKKVHHAEEEDQDHSESGALKQMMRLMVEGNERAETRRVAEVEARRIEKLEEEERAEKRRIAAEERAEVRRLAEVVAAEDRAEAKRIRKEVAAAEAEKERERAAQAASEQLKEQQLEFAASQFEQQKALLEVQARLGEKAAQAHREEQSILRKRDKAIASVPSFRDGEDVEEFLMTAERRLKAGGIPEEEWLTIVGSKLGGRMGSVWQDMSVGIEDYQELKMSLLKVCGYVATLLS